MALNRICKTEVITTMPDTSVFAVAQTMSAQHVGCVIVVEEHRPVDNITDSDIIAKLVTAGRDRKSVAVKEVMATNPSLININYEPFLLVWSLIMLCLLGGCARQLPPYPTQAASSYLYFQNQDGLAIGIKPLTDPQESEKYFHTDLLSRGVLAIFVAAENRDSPKSFFLLKDRFTLQSAQKEEHPISGREQVKSDVLDSSASAFKAMMLAGSAAFWGVGGIPFALVGGPIAGHEEAVKRKFVLEELQPQTISLGEGTHGFVYFPRPPGYPNRGQWVLHLEAEDLNSKAVTVFDFPLNQQ